LESEGRRARQGLATSDDFRFVRAWWETGDHYDSWINFAKGGTYSPFYDDVHLILNWRAGGAELSAFDGSVVRNPDYYFRPGLTWPRRTKSKLSMRVMPRGCIFADKGPAIFVDNDGEETLFAILALTSSRVFHSLVEVQLAAADARPGGAAHSFEVGIIQRSPVPYLDAKRDQQLAKLSRRAWLLKRMPDTANEVSHAFLLPPQLRARVGDYDPPAVEAEMLRIQAEIDEIALEIYDLGDADRAAITRPATSAVPQPSNHENVPDANSQDDEEEETFAPANDEPSLLSWCVGVAFGRFCWRLATGERSPPPEPDPFDPLPSRSPGMLPEGSEPFHEHAGILIDDPGHPHDLARLVENVLERVEVPAPLDVRRWLQRDFFPYHLQCYSKSRRKAPIYWPLSTDSGGYTLWLYYPTLTNQTLYAAANDFVGPKLEETSKAAQALRTRTDRSRDEERRLEQLQDLEAELKGLQDELLRLAPGWKPNHDDGVQITAAPLWRLFRHRPWQKVLKETGAKLEAGDYDWAHLAMSYWPERVREKCRTDKSLAIAHGLEELYEPQRSDAAKV
jgi:hypothetical protein